MVDSTEGADWKKRLSILNRTLVSEIGQNLPLQADWSPPSWSVFFSESRLKVASPESELLVLLLGRLRDPSEPFAAEPLV